MGEETVTISLQYLKELEKESRILGALYAGGVDNWEWYEESLEGLED